MNPTLAYPHFYFQNNKWNVIMFLSGFSIRIFSHSRSQLRFVQSFNRLHHDSTNKNISCKNKVACQVNQNTGIVNLATTVYSYSMIRIPDIFSSVSSLLSLYHDYYSTGLH